MLPGILKIIDVKPYFIICEWNTGETRIIDFEKKLLSKSNSESSSYKKLLDKNIFELVKLDTTIKTIYWEGLSKMIDTDGSVFPANLDFSPEVLYEMSQPYLQT